MSHLIDMLQRCISYNGGLTNLQKLFGDWKRTDTSDASKSGTIQSTNTLPNNALCGRLLQQV
ncbi:hypothetical protein [Hymenobacter terricola]|uniref:hypothetical protein n=1 Tax=Hymenobacter terricola TaxID=2819236 RepID=UPI001CF0F99E|nr:hypothetical protein [Hymenobacter terricola]